MLILQKTETPPKFLYFPKRKRFLYFRKRKPKRISYISGNGNRGKKYLYFRKRNFFILQETELSYIFGKVSSEPWYTHNPEILRTGSIFRTLSNLEPKAYAEYCQINEGMFCKNSYLAHFLIFLEMKLPCPIFLLYFKK